MSSTFSANKGYELQATGENNGTWGVKLDAVLSTIDLNFGGRKNAVVTNANVTVSAADAQNVRHVISGTLSGNIQYIFPNAGAFYFVSNITTGNFTVTLVSAGGGANFILPQGATAAIFINPDNNNVEVISPQAGGTELTVVNVAGNTNVTLTATQAAQPLIELIGALTGSINVIFPTTGPVGGSWMVSNQTSGAFTITCKTAGGTGKIVAQGQSAEIWSDGTNIQWSVSDIATILGYVPANASGGTVGGALTVTGLLTATAGVTVSGGTLTAGALNAGAITGTTIVASTDLQTINAAGASVILTTTGHHQWQVLSNTDNGLYFIDNTAGGARLIIDSTGHASFTNDVTVSGNFNTNAINGTTITGSSIVSSTAINGVQCIATGGSAFFRSLVVGVRDWDFGGNTDGQFYIFDATAGLTRFLISTTGAVTVFRDLTVGTTLLVNSDATVGGNFNTNVISCTILNTNGNTITCGAINASGSVVLSAGNLTVSGNINGLNTVTGNAVVSNLTLTASGGINCAANGVKYTTFDTQFVAFRFNSGTSLQLFVNGTNIGAQNFNVSDERLKENIVPAEETALAELLAVKLISFDLPDRVNPELPAQHFDYGFSAQQLQTVIPEAVVESRRHELDNPSDETMLSLDTTPLLARCIGAIQQLTARIEALEAQLAAKT